MLIKSMDVKEVFRSCLPALRSITPSVQFTETSNIIWERIGGALAQNKYPTPRPPSPKFLKAKKHTHTADLETPTDVCHSQL